MISSDFQAFAGTDSISAVGSFVSTSVKAGSGDDTLFIGASSAGSTASTASAGGAGADLITASAAANVTIYGDTSADTAGGADDITVVPSLAPLFMVLLC